jgi:exosortase family protein XrtF
LINTKIERINRIAANNKTLLFFLFKLVLFAFIWFIGYENYLKPAGTIDSLLTKLTANATSLFLSPWFELEVTPYRNLQILVLNSVPQLGIAKNCNGLGVFFLFIAFMISFPGPLTKKLLYTIVGLLVLFNLNILRASALTVIQIYAPQYLDFNHKYTFIVIVYGSMFYLWHIWVTRFANQ